MTERRAVRPKARPVEVDVDERELIVVPYRPGRHSAKLLPPLLLVMLGTAFLAYRARSSDWRGLSLLFESRPKSADAPPLPLPPVPEAVPARAEENRANPAAEEGKKEEKEKEKEKETGEEKEKVKAIEKADPLDDIKKEAEATRERIAGLEKLKEQEARKLDESAAERGQATRLNRRNNIPPFRAGAGAVAPEQVERRLRAQSEQLRRQMIAMAQIQLRQMERMAAIQRDFFSNRDPGRMPWPVPPPPRPIFPTNPGLAQRPPNANGPGTLQLREFHGPNGMQGFRFEFRAEAPSLLDQPPPPPRPRNWN